MGFCDNVVYPCIVGLKMFSQIQYSQTSLCLVILPEIVGPPCSFLSYSLLVILISGLYKNIKCKWKQIRCFSSAADTHTYFVPFC